VSVREYRSGPLVWVGVIAATCLILALFQKILWLVVPFLLGLVIYYLLLPLKERLVLAGLARDASTNWVALGAFGAFGLVAVLGTPWLAAHLVGWQDNATRYLDGGLHFLVQSIAHLEGRFPLLAQAHASAEAERQISGLTDNFASQHLAAAAMTLAAWAPSLILAPILAYFMLKDGWRFKRFLGAAVPNAFFERTLYLFEQVDQTARLYFQGLLKLTAIDALCLAGGLWWLGISGPLLLGIMTAVLAWIPYVGSIAGCLLVVLVAATDFPGDPGVAYGAIVLFLAVRMLDDFVFMPLTVGRSLNMHPLLTILMIFVGGAVAGVPGLMLVLPLLGVIMVLGETLGMVLSDQRLMVRHRHAGCLRYTRVTRDLGAGTGACDKGYED
jgi:predicted PurR-regulated permease PerM